VKRKRRPGGGRKPDGKFAKGATFTTRLNWETRRALDEAAKKTGKSVSTTAEYILREGLKKPQGTPRNYSLACAVALLAEKIEDGTQKSWRNDAFTGEALHHAIASLLVWYTAWPSPGEGAEIPSSVKNEAVKMPEAFAKRFCEPAGFGQLLAFNLINEIQQSTSPSHDEWSLPIFFSPKPAQLALIGRDLGRPDSIREKSK
jgi:predicted transcriptional regulator